MEKYFKELTIAVVMLLLVNVFLLVQLFETTDTLEKHNAMIWEAHERIDDMDLVLKEKGVLEYKYPIVTPGSN